MSEKNVPNRRYTEEFREEAARLANSVGHNEAARRLGGRRQSASPAVLPQERMLPDGLLSF
jgi:transposase-like protein